MNRNRCPWGKILWCLLCATLLGCGRRPTAPTGPPAPEVEVSLPKVEDVTDYVEFTGHAEATDAVDIRARVSGYLVKGLRLPNQPNREGTEVKKDAVLFEIDPSTYEAAVNQAKANLLQNQAHVIRLKKDFARARELLPSRSIAQEDFDKIAGDLAEAEAAVETTQASLKIAQINLDFTKVLAPFDGRVSRQLIDPGNLVKADDTLLTTIVAIDPIYVYFDEDERTALQIRRLVRSGQVKSIYAARMPILAGLVDEVDESGNPKYRHNGVLNFVDNRLDAMSGTLRLRGEFPNHERMFSPGMFVRVRLPVGDKHKAVLIAEQALKPDQGQMFVYVVNDKDEIEYRRVTIGMLQNGLRVVKSGLQGNERIVVNGLQRIRPDTKKVVPTLKLMPVADGSLSPSVVMPASK